MNFITAKDIAKKLNKNVRFVYNYASEFGGFKIGGAWFFTEEGFSNAIQARQKVESHSLSQERTVHIDTLYKKRGRKLGSKNKKEIEDARDAVEDRHGVFATLEKLSRFR